MITREDLQTVSLLADLTPEQVDAIAARAADLTLDPGDWLIREGELAAFSFYSAVGRPASSRSCHSPLARHCPGPITQSRCICPSWRPRPSIADS